jgi:hypothetical protein
VRVEGTGLVIEGVGVVEESFSIVFLFFRRLFRMLTLPLMETGAIEILTLLVGMLAAVVVVLVVVVVVVGTSTGVVVVLTILAGGRISLRPFNASTIPFPETGGGALDVDVDITIDDGLDWIGLDWIGLDWIGLEWFGSLVRRVIGLA